jgi:uncharacterized protein YchJ
MPVITHAANRVTLAAATMGHDHHFLSRLDRVSLPHVELALSLYRDDQARSNADPKREEGPARKGPCRCGSGKKYKHCCESVPVA